MLQRFKVRLFPDEKQEVLLWKSVGVARFAWNWGLAFQMKRFADGEKLLSAYDLRDEFRKLRDQEEFQWLKEVQAKVPYLSIYDLDSAYRSFFKIWKTGEKFTKTAIAEAKQKGRKLTPYDMEGHPKFKKKGFSKPAFAIPNDTLYFKKGCAPLQIIGKVKYRTDYELPEGRLAATFYNPRISFANGKWILSFSMEVPDLKVELNDYSLGIDPGVKSLATVSYETNSHVFPNINKTERVRRLRKRLEHAQRAFSRKEKESNNSRKALERVQMLHTKLSNIRHDYTHKVTTEIVEALPKSIVIEDLDVSGMMKNHHLARAISEQNFHKFIYQLKYKTARRGIQLITADRWFPSSRKCSACGAIKKDLRLSDRIYRCPSCGLEIDRDLNAARNLEKLAFVN